MAAGSSVRGSGMVVRARVAVVAVGVVFRGGAEADLDVGDAAMVVGWSR